MNRRHTLLHALLLTLTHSAFAQAAPDALPLRNLLIEVRQMQSDESQRAGVDLGSRPGVQMNQSRHSGTATQQALVLNGRPVRLALQTTTPIRLLQGFVRNGQVVTTVGTVLLEAGTGFSATPRWDGGTLVELELSAQQALRNTVPGAVASAATSSVLALPLEVWTTVGESEQSLQSGNSGLTGGQQQSGQGRTEVQVRVSLR